MLKNIHKASLVIAVVMGVVLLSCERENVRPFKSTEYVVAPENLTADPLVTPAAPVNLQFDSAAISTTLSESVSWTLTLKGASSGATKTFTGISKDINVKWGGNHDGLYFFRQGENVIAELSFVGIDKVVKDTFAIQLAKAYDGLILFDGKEFEAALNGWPDFSFAETGETGVALQRLTTNPHGILGGVRGTGAFRLAGSDVNNTYFVAGVRDQSSMPGTKQYFDLRGMSPDSIFFNVFVYGTGNHPTMGGIGVGEDDDLDGTYEDNKFHSEDTWDFQFRVDWKGWKLVSAPYSVFQKSGNPLYGGTGNGTMEPDRIRQITFNLLSSPPLNDVEIIYDFPIVTFGKPFNPHE